MELAVDKQSGALKPKSGKKIAGKVILSVVFALIPIILSGVMTFKDFPLKGLYVFLIGLGIGLMLIPFMLTITSFENWSRRWYIWVTIVLVCVLVFAMPIFKKGAGADNMQPPAGQEMINEPVG